MKIAFVYAGGRECRFADARSGNVPTDFFYGAVELERKGHMMSVHDLNSQMSGIIVGLCNRIFRRWLPPKTSIQDILATRRLLPRFRSVDVIVATASGCAFALAFWKKLGMLNSQLVGIHCGIVNCQHDRARRRSAAALFKVMHAVLFADNEVREMQRQFLLESVTSAWFGVDDKFWSLPVQGNQRLGVLAIGNDSRRDYRTLVSAAALLPEIPFRIVTSREVPMNLPTNVTVIRGDWKLNAISDAALRELYQSASCVVLPLIDSIQPAGQSVGMQAMMCGTPVVMTRTRGWWGRDVLREGENIVSVPPGDSLALAQAIAVTNKGDSAIKARLALLAARWTSAGFAGRLETVCLSSRRDAKEQSMRI